MAIRAEGYSYDQICQATGFSYTKVNRSLSEGRQALLSRVAGIEAGAECRRLAPALSALADGEAGSEELAALRPHLRSCLACRARLREYRAAPARVAALVPPALVAAAGSAGSGDGPGFMRGLIESLIGATQDKAAAFGERAHAAAELASAQKVAAVAASAAAVAGGGAAGVEQLRGEEPERAPAPPAKVEPVKEELPAPVAVEPPAAEPEPAPAPEGEPAPAPPPEPPPPDPANEFAPAPPTAPASAPAPAPAPAPSGRLGPSGAGPAGNAGGGEFGP